ncbi:MAG: hypothetical protein WAW37_19225 [Syntrophobacteraceae bacterium]
MNFHQKITVGITDVVILVELSVSLYLANQDPENYASVFCKYFFSMLVPTLILAKIFIRKLGAGEPRREQ